MTRSRLRPVYSLSSRSRVASSLGRAGSYANPLVPRSRAGADYYPSVVSRSHGVDYDTTALDYHIDDAISRSTSISSAALDDIYDTSAKSRGRDRRLLTDTTSAIVSSETHSSPRTAVAARRATRGRSPVTGGYSLSSSYKSTLTSQSRPATTQVAVPARLQLASSAPAVIRVSLRGTPSLIIMPRGGRAKLSGVPGSGGVARGALQVSPRDVRVVAAGYGAPLAPYYPVLASYGVAKTPRARAGLAPVLLPALFASLPPRVLAAKALPGRYVRLADLSYRRLGLPPRFRKYAQYYDYRRLAVPVRAARTYRSRPPVRKYLPEPPRQRRPPRSVYARVLRAVLYGEQMPKSEPVPTTYLSPLARVLRLYSAQGILRKLAPSLAHLPGLLSQHSLQAYLFPAAPFVPYEQAEKLAPSQGRRRRRVTSARPPKMSKARKAAIIASKLETEEPRRRKPRSKYAAEKLRSVLLEKERGLYAASPYVPQSTSLHASKPPLPLPSDRKAVRDVDGATKPRNLLSWQYRLESRVDPVDIYQPGTFARLRSHISETQDKLDKHRQLMDRYLPAESGVSESVEGSILRKMEELEKRDFLNHRKGAASKEDNSPRRH